MLTFTSDKSERASNGVVHITGHYRDGSFQPITCTGADNQSQQQKIKQTNTKKNKITITRQSTGSSSITHTKKHKNPMTTLSIILKFNSVLAVVKVHMCAKFHQAECSGSWVIVHTEKKNIDENNTVVATTNNNKLSTCTNKIFTHIQVNKWYKTKNMGLMNESPQVRRWPWLRCVSHCKTNEKLGKNQTYENQEKKCDQQKHVTKKLRISYA